MKERSKPEPLDLETTDVTENDRLHAATSIQSSVTPQQYPLIDREIQTAAATTGQRMPKSKAHRQ